jgi:hypothetical protein
MREIFPHFGVTLLHCAKNKGVLRLFVIIWAFTHKVQCKLQDREYLGWIFSLLSVMMVFSAELTKVGLLTHSLSLYISTPSARVTSSPRAPPSKTSEI